MEETFSGENLLQRVPHRGAPSPWEVSAKVLPMSGNRTEKTAWDQARDL